MRRQDAAAVALLMGASMFLGAAVYYASPARADEDDLSPAVVAYTAGHSVAVCTTLSEFPSAVGIYGIAEAIADDGFTRFEAGEIIALSVAEVCPRYSRLLSSFAHKALTALP